MVPYRNFPAALALLLATSATVALADPVPPPNPHIPGYSFPEPEATILDWVNKPTAAHRKAIDLHGWGLWTALTAPSGQTEFGIANVPVYFTWLTPEEVRVLPPGPTPLQSSSVKPKRVLQLETPEQFSHGKVPVANVLSVAPSTSASTTPDSQARDTVSLITEGYAPSTAEFVRQNQLLSLSALKALYDAGKTAVPGLPNDAIATKPIYKVISSANKIGSIYVMPSWPGTPDAAKEPNGFPETAWPGCVYIDTNNSGTSHAHGIDKNCSGPTAQNTFGLGDFITYPVTAGNVGQIQKFIGKTTTPLVVGDYIILIGMHIAAAEMTEWTWETFFWTPDPARPPLPSSARVAANRPAQLSGPAAHYAMSVGDQMIAPNQPINGGTSVGIPVIVYNPYIEAAFGPGTFGAPPTNVGIYNPKTKKTFTATLGTQTNCMSCHAQASVPFATGAQPANYVTDFYTPRTDPSFTGYLQTAFLWSIADKAK